MLTTKMIIENKNLVIERLKKRNVNASDTVNKIIELDAQRRGLTNSVNQKQAEMNTLSRQIGQFFSKGEKEKAEDAKKNTLQLKEQIKTLNQQINEVSTDLNEQLVLLPNIPHESVPGGTTDQDNEEIETGGKIPELKESQMPHWDLAAKYNIIDFGLGNKITGAGFPVYLGKGAKLQRALISFFLDEAQKEGYNEVCPPLLVNEDSGFGTGQLPDKEGQMYHVTEDNLYMVPTAEVPLTNIYRDVILDEADLPVKVTAYTPCFRREAGSWGKEVRGLNRLHQFDKVEIVQIQHPDESYDTLNNMMQYALSLVKKLELPYRVLRLCGGDLGFTSALTYDLEVFAAGQQKWLEVSSVSNFETFQSNRLKIRFKEQNKKQNRLVHTLNGSALALPRIVAALLENNQTKDGIKIPGVLKPYTGFTTIL